MTFKAGLVGAGNISRFHVQALRRLPNVEITGVTDLNPHQAQRFAEEMGIKAYASLEELRDAGAQVIHVVTPPATHVAVAVDAVALGCDVFVEKPLATSAEDCARIERAALDHNRRVCVGHSLLYDPFVRRAMGLVRAGAIGDVLAFDYFRSQNNRTYASAAISEDQQRGGYPFRDIGIHALYLAEAFVGPVIEMDGWPSATGRGDCNLWLDEWRVVARCERGTAHAHLSWNVRPQQHLIVLQGTHGILRCDLFGMSVTVRKQRPLPEHATRVLNTLSEAASTAMQSAANVGRVLSKKLWQFHGVQALIAEFYACLESGRDAPVMPSDARRVVFFTEQLAERGDEMKKAWVAGVTSNRSHARTLITGAGGFIGQDLVTRLLAQGQPLRLFVRRPPPAAIASNPLVEIVLGDLADAAAVSRAVEGIDTVYHVGATMRGSVPEFERGNITGTRNIVENCVRCNVRRLVYMSSLAIIDTDAGKDTPITEESPLERRTSDRGHYTRTKLEAEAIVTKAVRERGLRAIILRPGEVVGPKKPLLTPGVAQRAGKILIVIGNGRVRLPLVHVQDVVDAVIDAADADLPNGVVLQLVDDCAVTQNDIISHYLSTTGERLRVLRLPLKLILAIAAVVEALARRVLGSSPLGPRRIRAATASRRFDCRQAERLLGWKPRVGVAAAFASERSTNHRAAQGTLATPNVDPAAT